MKIIFCIYLFIFWLHILQVIAPRKKIGVLQKSTEELDSTKKMAIGAYLVIYYEETGMVYLITTECNCVI